MKAGADGATTLYLHVLDWPGDGKLAVPGLRSQVARASLLGGGAALETTSHANGVVVTLPTAAPDPVASVVKLEIDGALEVTRTLPGPDAAGVVRFEPAAAETGGSVRVESHAGRPCLGNWGFWLDAVAWEFDGHAPGKYRVTAELAGTGPVRLSVSCAGKSVEAPCAPGNTPEEFTVVDLGTMEIGAGQQTIVLIPVKNHWRPIRLASVTLTPARGPEEPQAKTDK
jgi:alpha-L-fucosidase